jgi:hypothetical protein
MVVMVEISHLRWQYEIYRSSNLRVESAHQICVNNIFCSVPHIKVGFGNDVFQLSDAIYTW